MTSVSCSIRQVTRLRRAAERARRILAEDPDLSRRSASPTAGPPSPYDPPTRCGVSARRCGCRQDSPCTPTCFGQAATGGAVPADELVTPDGRVTLRPTAVVGAQHGGFTAGSSPVPTKNLIRTVCVTDRAVLGRRTITSVGMADVRSVEVDGRLASFGRSSGRRVSVHGLQAPAIRGCGQAACRW